MWHGPASNIHLYLLRLYLSIQIQRQYLQLHIFLVSNSERNNQGLLDLQLLRERSTSAANASYAPERHIPRIIYLHFSLPSLYELLTVLPRRSHGLPSVCFGLHPTHKTSALISKLCSFQPCRLRPLSKPNLQLLPCHFLIVTTSPQPLQPIIMNRDSR